VIFAALTLTSTVAAAQDPNPPETKPAEGKPGETKPEGAAAETKPLEQLPPPAAPTVTTKTTTEVDKTEVKTPVATKLELKPYAVLAGGLKGDNVIDKKGEDKDDRFVTFAVSRFGLSGTYGVVAIQSELMASGGIGLHGTSAYEGQAALQVRQQLIRLTYEPVMVEVGRILDEASIDYISAHVQDTLVQDTATRDPLLYSGFNLGNGIRSTVALVPKMLRLGLTINAGNPVSTTSTLAVGGTYPPFERIYTQAYQAVNQGPNHFPDDTFHAVVVTPAVLFDHQYVDARVAFQGFDINTNTTKAGDDHVRGFNVRGTIRGKFLEKMLVPFFSSAYTRNDTLQPNNLDHRSKDRYQALDVGGGLDVNISRRFTGYEDAADGVGAQYQQVQFIIGEGVVTTLRYVNVGGSFWLTPNVALGARLALWVQQQKGAEDFGERTATVGLRAVIP
jgi:hypothetical protein